MTDAAEDQEHMRASLEAKLQPWRIRATLSFAGLYQVTHELLKQAVADQVRQFYLTGFDEQGYTYDEDSYTTQVLALAPKKRFRASLLWLVRGGAISLSQADRLDAIYAHRHELTHQLAKYLVDPEFEPDVQLFSDALAILKSIHRFWTEVEIGIGSFDEHGEVSVDDVIPGSLLMLQTFIDAYPGGLSEIPTE